jgi:hypothetical protein
MQWLFRLRVVGLKEKRAERAEGLWWGGWNLFEPKKTAIERESPKSFLSCCLHWIHSSLLWGEKGKISASSKRNKRSREIKIIKRCRFAPF